MDSIETEGKIKTLFSSKERTQFIDELIYGCDLLEVHVPLPDLSAIIDIVKEECSEKIPEIHEK